MQDKYNEKDKCVRVVEWHGKCETIVAENHSFAWSGRIPCTGLKKCIYCGAIKNENH